MSRMGETLVLLYGERGRETDKAVLFTITRINLTVLDKPIASWFPFSQIKSSFTNPTVDDGDTLTVTEWIANQKGLLGIEHKVRTSKPTEIQGTSMSIKTHMDEYDDDIPF